jgi:hypothetical protein
MQDMNPQRNHTFTDWIQPTDYWVDGHMPGNSHFESSNDRILAMPTQSSVSNVYKTTFGTAQESYKGFIEPEHASGVYKDSYTTAQETYNGFIGAVNASSGYKDTFTTAQDTHSGVTEVDNASESSTAMSFSYSEDESSNESPLKSTSKVSKSEL